MSAVPPFGASFVTLSGVGFVGAPRFDFERRAAAAAVAGFTSIGVRIADLVEPGRTLSSALEVPARYGLTVTEVEFLDGWAQASSPEVALATVPLLRDLAGAWGPFHVTSGEFNGGLLDIHQAAAHLAVLADALTGTGVRLAVEAFGWSAISDYDVALQIVRRAGADGVGLMIDVWHFFNTHGSLDWLRALRPEDIAAVQLNDGVLVTTELRENARNGRLLPGEGSLDVTGLLRVVRDIGFTGHYLVESSYPEFRDLDVTAAAERAFTRATRSFESA